MNRFTEEEIEALAYLINGKGIDCDNLDEAILEGMLPRGLVESITQKILGNNIVHQIIGLDEISYKHTVSETHPGYPAAVYTVKEKEYLCSCAKTFKTLNEIKKHIEEENNEIISKSI